MGGKKLKCSRQMNGIWGQRSWRNEQVALERCRRRPGDEWQPSSTELHLQEHFLPGVQARVPPPAPPPPPPPHQSGSQSSSAWGPALGVQITKQKREATTPRFPPPRKECLFACLANHLCCGLSFLTCFLVIVHIACQHDNTFSKSSSLAPKHKLSFLIFVGHLSPPGHSLFYITVDRNTILFCAFSPPLGINVSSCCYIVCVIIILWLYNCIEF